MIKKKKEKGSNESNIEIQGDPKKQPIKILLIQQSSSKLQVLCRF